MELPLELRRNVYKYCDLTTTSFIDAAVLKNYVKGKPTSICSLVGTNSTIRAEAFEFVLHQNEVDLIGVKQVFHLIKTYIGKTQIQGFNFWHNIYNVTFFLKTRASINIAKVYLQDCTNVRNLKMISGKDRYYNYVVRKHVYDAKVWKIIDGLKMLETVHVGLAKWRTVPMSKLPPGSKTMKRFVDWDPERPNRHIRTVRPGSAVIPRINEDVFESSSEED